MHFHVTIPSEGRFEAFNDPHLLRRAVRALARVIGPRLISWALPGNHVHAVATGTRAEVGLLARNLRFSFRALGIRLDEAHHRPITGVDDLQSVVAYQLRQAKRHGTSDRPALFEGGCFLDLVGARFVEGFDAKLVLKHLPRFDLSRHLHEVAARGLPTPIPESEIRSVGAMRLIEATTSALAVGPDLSSDAPPVVTARRVAVALGTAAGISRKELAFALDVAPQSIGRLERATREPRLELVVRTRLGVDAIALIVERKPEKR
jgi:hypothetical protein